MLWEYVILLRHYAKKLPNFTQINIIECTWYTCTETLTWLPIRSKTDREPLHFRRLSWSEQQRQNGEDRRRRRWWREAVGGLYCCQVSISLSLASSLHWFWKWSPHDSRSLVLKGIILLLFSSGIVYRDECTMVTWDDMIWQLEKKRESIAFHFWSILANWYLKLLPVV